MKKSKINHLLEYLSPIMILSYYFIHDISLVIIGIIISLYSINSNFIDSSIRSINEKLSIKKVDIKLNQKYQLEKLDSINTESTIEDSKLTLVEAIEELGFIPSIDKNNNISSE